MPHCQSDQLLYWWCTCLCRWASAHEWALLPLRHIGSLLRVFSGMKSINVKGRMEEARRGQSGVCLSLVSLCCCLVLSPYMRLRTCTFALLFLAASLFFVEQCTVTSAPAACVAAIPLGSQTKAHQESLRSLATLVMWGCSTMGTTPQTREICPKSRGKSAGLSLREEKKGGGGRKANRNERSRGRSLLHGQDMGKTQDHRNGIEQWLAVGSGWRLAAVGGWQLAVGGWWSLRGVRKQKRIGGLEDSPEICTVQARILQLVEHSLEQTTLWGVGGTHVTDWLATADNNEQFLAARRPAPSEFP